MEGGKLESVAMPTDHATDKESGKVEKVRRPKIESVARFVAVHYGSAKYVVVTIDKDRKQRRIVKGSKTVKPIGYVGLCFADMGEAYDYAVDNDGELWSNERDSADHKIGKLYPFYGVPTYHEGDKDSRKGIERNDRTYSTPPARPTVDRASVPDTLPHTLQVAADGWPVSPLSGDEVYTRQRDKDRKAIC